MIKHEEPVLSANEAACVTEMPLKQVHRIIDGGLLSGAPRFKGTRITVHDIAEMLANGDRASAIPAAYPMLSEAQVAAAAIYAEAYPRRGRPRRQARWRDRRTRIRSATTSAIPAIDRGYPFYIKHISANEIGQKSC